MRAPLAAAAAPITDGVRDPPSECTELVSGPRASAVTNTLITDAVAVDIAAGLAVSLSLSVAWEPCGLWPPGINRERGPVGGGVWSDEAARGVWRVLLDVAACRGGSTMAAHL